MDVPIPQKIITSFLFWVPQAMRIKLGAFRQVIQDHFQGDYLERLILTDVWSCPGNALDSGAYSGRLGK